MTDVLEANESGIARAGELLRTGELVAFGTETVYGLGADATNPQAVAAIFATKGRPRFNPLIAHFPSAARAFADADATSQARALAAAFWPGPLTLVLPRRSESRIALLTSAGLDSIAVRVPGHDIARAVLCVAGMPVAAPSANPSGRVSPTTAAQVLAGLGGRIAAVLDSGPCQVGIESTVLDLTGKAPVLLRPGGVAVEEIEALVGAVQRIADATSPKSPGMLASHYAPSAALRLDVREVRPDEALLAFGPALPGAYAVFNLSEGCDVSEAASRFFTGLRELDKIVGLHGLTGIASMPVPWTGLGLAINDRLRRAAAPR